MKEVIRHSYLQWLKEAKDKDLIKVVTGIRRSGKSTLLEQFQDYLMQMGITKDQIIFINFEDFENLHLIDPEILHKFILDSASKNGKTYVFLDEVQLVSDFQRVVDSLYLRKNLDIYITGSNASLLSGELATLLTGRYIELQILPLSFKEYAEIYASEKLTNFDLYNEYISTTSFPYVSQLGYGSPLIDDYLEGVVDSVLFRDVVSRLNNCDESILMSIVRFMASTVGNRLNPRKIADSMASAGRKVDPRTVEKYMSALLDSHIFYEASRFDVKAKAYLSRLEKYYIADIGLRNSILGSYGEDAGSILENIVYLELLRREKNVFVGKLGDQEIDFVTEGKDGIKYYQVSASVRNKDVLERELAPLQKTRDSYPKWLLTLDEDLPANIEGIKKMNVLDWLLE